MNSLTQRIICLCTVQKRGNTHWGNEVQDPVRVQYKRKVINNQNYDRNPNSNSDPLSVVLFQSVSALDRPANRSASSADESPPHPPLRGLLSDDEVALAAEAGDEDASSTNCRMSCTLASKPWTLFRVPLPVGEASETNGWLECRGDPAGFK